MKAILALALALSFAPHGNSQQMDEQTRDAHQTSLPELAAAKNANTAADVASSPVMVSESHADAAPFPTPLPQGTQAAPAPHRHTLRNVVVIIGLVTVMAIVLAAADK